MATTVRVLVLGAGGRGRSHARRIVEAGGTIVGVADPNPTRRDRLADDHGVAANRRWAGWAEVAAYLEAGAEPFADAVLVATQDADHLLPCERFAALGYPILCEKPMAPTEPDAVRIANAVNRADVPFAICHTLRYSDYTRRLRSAIQAGRIGRVVAVQHMEPVGWWHFAHSYVRGNWRREGESSSMLLAKSCHDIDWLNYVIGSRPVTVFSSGRLSHFRPEERPEGAADRCLDCSVESTCPYSAPRLYRHWFDVSGGRSSWIRAVTDDATADGLDRALAEGPYGRCVYACDNDVVDHQIVSLDYANGVTATHTVTAFTPMSGRLTRVCGTLGYLEGNGASLRYHDFRSPPDQECAELAGASSGLDGHEDGDRGVVRAFLQAVATGDRSTILSGPMESVDSHRAVWAAERSRATGRAVSLTPSPDRPETHL